jgi:cytochrome d ubiquinol oxidase subunit I
MEFDTLFLSRLQFAITIMFHYIFPPLSIGLGWMMVFMEGMYLKTGNKEYEAIARFWTSIFAVVFAMGVATGIVMEFQFGTNWSRYSAFVGDIFGAALAAEGIFAFFLESGFLAVLVFGWDKVSPAMHFFSTCMVSLGAVFSSIWIIVANSWQQTPAGYKLVQMMRNGEPWVIDGEPVMRAELDNFVAAVLNPSTVHRLVHVWIGAGILGAFFVLSISSYYILKKQHEGMAKKMFALALVLGLFFSVAMPISGDLQANNVGVHQPAKLAAFEGLYKTPEEGEGADLYLFGWADSETETVKGGIAIPGLLSFLMHRDFGAPVEGLDQTPKEDWPPVNMVFQFYHIMLGLGMLFLGMTGLAAFYWWRGTIFEKRWLLWAFVFAVPLPFVANELGWAAAEVGRQPWVVWGLLRTSEAYSTSVSAGEVLFSIILFVVIYTLLFFLWLYILDTKIRRGPSIYLEAPDGEHKGGFFEAAAARVAEGGPSLTSARDDAPHEGE